MKESTIIIESDWMAWVTGIPNQAGLIARAQIRFA